MENEKDNFRNDISKHSGCTITTYAMSGTLAERHVSCLVIVHVIGIKAMGIVTIGICKVIGISMHTKEGDQDGCTLFYGVVGARH